MAVLPLQEILIFDNGINTPDSWSGPLHTPMQDFVRLACDLLLLTRVGQSATDRVNFSDIPALIDEADERMSKQVAEIISWLAVVKTPVGLIWVKREDQIADARTPTPGEVADFEGESRLLYDAASDLHENQARRLFAAWGVYCCERAMRAMKKGGKNATVATLVASAGTLLGHANWCSGWGTRSNHATEERRRGARARLEKDPKTKAKKHARELWDERRAGKHPKLRTNSQFAMECMRRWPELTSHDVIAAWCTEWNKQAKKT